MTLTGSDAGNYAISSSSPTTVTALANIERATPVINFGSGSVVSKFIGDNPFTNAVSISVPGLTGNVAYTSSDASIATVDPVSGEVTIVGSGTVTISVSVAATATSFAETRNYTLSVAEQSSGSQGETLNPEGVGNQSITSTVTPQPQPLSSLVVPPLPSIPAAPPIIASLEQSGQVPVLPPVNPRISRTTDNANTSTNTNTNNSALNTAIPESSTTPENTVSLPQQTNSPQQAEPDNSGQVAPDNSRLEASLVNRGAGVQVTTGMDSSWLRELNRRKRLPAILL